LAQIHWRQRKFAEAEAELKSALEIYATTLPPDHQYVASAEYLMGEVLLALNRLPDAEAMLTASMNRWKRTDAPAWRAARSASALGEAMHRQGRNPQAEKYLLEGYEVIGSQTGADPLTKQRTRERLAKFYVDTNQRDKLNALNLVSGHDATAAAARPN
jgi:tetratricopeptide (TPR) repeat protein